jgi:uncharacterized protein (DUF433 family)
VTGTPSNLLSADDLRLYGGADPRDLPCYTFPEAAKAVDIPVSTLRSWFVGQSYRSSGRGGFFRPVIHRPSPHDPRLSFTNLIEAHVLRALRRVHEVSLENVRQAILIAQKSHHLERLLISPDLYTSAGVLFIEHYSHLIELTKAEQLAMKSILNAHLKRVEFDETRLPNEFMPFERNPDHIEDKVISLSPFYSFGQAVIRRRRISTRAIVERIKTGESQEAIMADYDLTEVELEEAIYYEAA